jgi:hypothetical protein
MAGFFDTLFSGGAEKEAADRNRALTAQYGTQAQDYLKTGYNTGVGNLNQAIDAYKPLSELAGQYNKGGSLYLDALGVNGPGGNANATGAFQAGPGYQFALDQGLDAVNRRRAAGGMFDSGNADIDTLKFAQGLGNQEYQNWLTRLQGAGQTGVGLAGTVAGGQAQGYGNLANLANKYATDQTGVAGNQLSSNVNSSNLQAQGEASGAKNLLGAGLSLASLAMGVPGMGGGLGSILGGGAGAVPGAVGATSVGGSQGFAPLAQPSLFNRMFG